MIFLLPFVLLVAGAHGFAGSAHLCDEIQTVDCGKQYTPSERDEVVCGSDGKTYNNYCYYSQARCTTPTTHIAYVGTCSNTTPTKPTTTTTTMATKTMATKTMLTATAPTVTDTTTKMTNDDDHATMTMATATAPIVTDTTTKMPTTTTMPAKTTQDTLQQVFCASKDSVTCGTDLDPICGSDTNFYLNKCEFSKAVCDNRSLVSKSIDFCTGAGR